MGSTFSGIELSKRGLAAQQQGIHTTGHNISNADNKSYARQRVNIGTNDPIYDASLNRAMIAGQIGQGASVTEVERIRDMFLDDRIAETNTEKNYWGARQEYLHQVEVIFGEPGNVTLRNHMDQFWSSLEELSKYPEESAQRSVVKEKAIGLSSRIEDTFKKLSVLKDQADKEVEVKTNLLNGLAEQVRVLNERITKAEAMGDNPNDLYDRREKIVEELSGLVDLSIGRSDRDEFMIFIGQQILVQGSKKNEIVMKGNAEYEGKQDLYWKHNDERVILENGRIQGVIEVRDFVLAEKIAQIDTFAVNLKDTVNSIHKDGFGLNGKTNLNFFEEKNLATNSFGEYDSNGDGVNDITAVYRVSGRTSVNADRPIGIEGTITLHGTDAKHTPALINYSKDDTLNDVIRRINGAKTGITASLNQDSQLTLKATANAESPRTSFMIRHIEDSGQLLVGVTGILNGTGAAGSFDYRKTGEYSKLQAKREDITLTPYTHPASFVKVSDEIQNNVQSIAAARGKDLDGSGDYNKPNWHKDGANALLMAASLREKPVMVEYSKSFGEFYSSIIAKIGTEAREAKMQLDTRNAVITEYENLRQSIMGVNINEEMTNMIQFQQSFNASARMMNTQNEMLDVIINRLGR